MAEYIDRERLLRDIDKFVRYHLLSVADVERIIKGSPALDLTSPRRCVNCAHSYEDLSGLVCSYGPLVDCTVRRDFYCAYWKDNAEEQAEIQAGWVHCGSCKYGRHPADGWIFCECKSNCETVVPIDHCCAHGEERLNRPMKTFRPNTNGGSK